MEIRIISRGQRQRRLVRLFREVSGYETAMRDRCAQMLELADPDDDFTATARRLLEALEY
ncbi:MAG: hypothetical protein QM522_10690 [Chitinophagaceae bacterium]|nr:hypothetical protein [Chitinophagaceae bacterium]MDI9407159.1 hypothetical protein [Chitinophagaceae bacterium]